jgi:acetyl esterase
MPSDGGTYDSGLLQFLARTAAPPRRSFADMSPVEAREASSAFFGLFSAGPDVAFEDRLIEGRPTVAVRVYRPSSPPSAVILYLHGGGWVLGSVQTFHGITSALAAISGAVIVAVDYRLAPEHPFPAALDDAWTALRWAVHLPDVTTQHVPIGVMGDSSGGNLAAVLARRARDAGLRLAQQILVYPALDRRFDSPSYERFACGFGLTRREMQWFWDHYVGSRTTTADMAPIATHDLAGLAPAVVLTAEIDVLRSEGEAYGAALAASGVPVVARRAQGMPHGFLSFVNDVPAVAELLCDVFRSVLRV